VKISEKEKTSIYDNNLTLLYRYREGDKEAGEELCRLNAPLVYSIAGRFSERTADISELYEVGTLGLVKAINTFDFSRECAFSTYAVPLIFGEIRRFLRDDGIIKVSREEKKLSAALNAERERRLALGERPTIKELADSQGVSPQDAARALFASFPLRSLDEAVYDDDGGVTLGATVYDEDEAARSFEKTALFFAIDQLSKIEKSIIVLRYFRDMSQSLVAKALGISQVKVSRMEKKLLSKLREKLKE
jgi:RNA polymerase sporulation-specific sigma factor